MAGSSIINEAEKTDNVQTNSEQQQQVAEDREGDGTVAAIKATTTNELLAQECLIKHPLHNKWTLWYLEHDRKKSWEQMQNRITAFDTVEDFWSLYNHIRVASELGPGNDYSLFKRSIRPMWEDETNKRGGRWLITLRHAQRRLLDQLWLDILLIMIGESFESSEDICGAVVNIRPRGDKIAVWTADGTNEASIKNIGSKIRSTLSLPNDQPLVYELHEDSVNKHTKPKYTM